MYRELGLSDTKLGMILLYSAVNVSLAVWLLKGVHRRDPARVRGGRDGGRLAHAAAGLPQGGAAAGGTTGIVATAIFCLIFAWNEYAFAVLLTSGEGATAPPFIPIIIGEGGRDWPAVAAGTMLFLVPILVFTVLLRKHLLRGITFEPSAKNERATRPYVPHAREIVGLHRDRAGHVMMLQPFALVLFTVVRHDARRCRLFTIVSKFPLTDDGRSGPELPHKAFAEFVAVKDPSFTGRRRRVLLPARPVGLRQDDHFAHDCRARAAHPGRSSSATRTSPSERACAHRDIAFVFQLFALYRT